MSTILVSHNKPAYSFVGTQLALNTSAVEVLATLILGGRALYVDIDFENVSGGGAVNSFVVERQAHPNGAWHSFMSDSDFGSTTNPNLVFATTATGYKPHDVTVGNNANACIRVVGCYAIRFSAKIASGAAQAIIRGTVLNAWNEI
jgi:hypothetical protein